jgi:hypothetical protein
MKNAAARKLFRSMGMQYGLLVQKDYATKALTEELNGSHKQKFVKKTKITGL